MKCWRLWTESVDSAPFGRANDGCLIIGHYRFSGVGCQASKVLDSDTVYETGYGKIKVGPTPLARHTQDV